MDFVQRNLINERNNLQVELAKAKAIIAQLNELSNKTLGSYIKKASGVDTGPSFIPAPPWHPAPKNDVANLDQNAHQNYTFQNLEKLKNRKEGIGRAVDQLTSRLVPKPTNEQAEYISDLENVIASIAESMNVSVEDLLNEGEARNQRLAFALNKAAMKIGAGKKRLEMMDQHVSNVAKTQGGEAGNVADIAVSRLRGPTERGVRDAQAKSGKLETALNTGMAAVKRSRVKRQTNGLFSNSLNKAKQGERVGSIRGGIETSQTPLHTRETPKTYMNPNGGKEITIGTVAKVGFRSASSLAAQGKLPTKKFGTGADQKTNLAAMRLDSEAKRAAQAQAQSTAAKARNNANKPV
jgi:hypothetical protein